MSIMNVSKTATHTQYIHNISYSREVAILHSRLISFVCAWRGAIYYLMTCFAK